VSSSLPAYFVYAGTELEGMAEARNYYAWLLSYFGRHLKGSVIEVGAGVGTLSRLILGFQAVRQLAAVEPAENLFPILSQRLGGDRRAKPLKGYLHDIAAEMRADTLVSVNVLEHVEDDGAFLRAAFQVLSPGGTCLLFVPAVSALYGSLDRAFDHFRRYGKKELALKLRAAGFAIELLRYFNLPGVLAWFMAGKILRKTSLRARDTRFYDRWVVPWISVLERYWEPPIGQSLLVVARKPVENV
jgi:SAM-dependent methyltransferase